MIAKLITWRQEDAKPYRELNHLPADIHSAGHECLISNNYANVVTLAISLGFLKALATFFNTMAVNGLQVLYRYAIPASIAYTLAQSSIYDVKGGTRAVIFDRLSGVKETVVNEGTHFLIPWLQRSIIYDVRTKPRNISTTTGSKDLQMVSLTLRVLHRPEVQKLPKIYQV